MQNIDNPVQVHVEDTNAIATMAKLSAIKQKYFIDEFSEEFVKPNQKKDVIIHRGYWCRFHIFHRVVSEFIQKQEKCNVISLGCGYDSLPYIMWQKHADKEFTFVETDLPVVVKRKIKKLNQSKKIQQLLGEITANDTKYEAKHNSKKYLLFGEDLCNSQQIHKQLASIDFTIPTLVYAECVLTYIHTDATNVLLENLSKWFEKLTFLNYEMFNPNDSFGKMMVKNFESRGCPLVGIEAFPSLDAHKTRLQRWFNHVEIYDMKTLYVQGTDPQERKRIESLELMDEWEEWNIMQSHYLVSLACKNDVIIHLIV